MTPAQLTAAGWTCIQPHLFPDTAALRATRRRPAAAPRNPRLRRQGTVV